MSILNCSSRDFLSTFTFPSFSRELLRLLWNAGTVLANWLAIVGKIRAEPFRPSSPLLKKYVAPSLPVSARERARLREIVDLPVPAAPEIQKMTSVSAASAHALMRFSMLTLVPSWHRGMS